MSGLISLQSKGLSRVLSSTIQNHQVSPFVHPQIYYNLLSTYYVQGTVSALPTPLILTSRLQTQCYYYLHFRVERGQVASPGLQQLVNSGAGISAQVWTEWFQSLSCFSQLCCVYLQLFSTLSPAKNTALRDLLAGGASGSGNGGNKDDSGHATMASAIPDHMALLN